MTQTLREIVEQAAHDIGYYRHPDISEAKARLDQIIVAADLGGILHDEIVGLEIYDGFVVVNTRYYVKSCEQTNRFQFPESLLDAPDPILAAKIWGLEENKADYVDKRDSALRAVGHYDAKIADIDVKLAALRS